MELWICPECGQEVYAKERPSNLRWTNGHVCKFLYPEAPVMEREGMHSSDTEN